MTKPRKSVKDSGIWIGIVSLAVISLVLLFFWKLFLAAPKMQAFLDVTVANGTVSEVRFVQQQKNKSGQDGDGAILNLSWQRDHEDSENFLFLPAFADLSKVTIRTFAKGNTDQTSSLFMNDLQLHMDSELAVENLEEGSYVLRLAEATLEDTSGQEAFAVKNEAHKTEIEEKTTRETSGKETSFTILKSQNLSSIWLTTETGLDFIEAAEEKDNYSEGYLKVLDEAGALSYMGKVEQISGHGNSSWLQPKKSLQINLKQSASLLGMKTGRKWLLVSNVVDDTNLRNKLFLDMASQMKLAYTPQADWADLYIDGNYRGLYLVTEKIDVSTGHIDIGNLERETAKVNQKPLNEYPNYYINAGNSELQGWQIEKDPSDISGGYLLEIDYPARYLGEPSKFITLNQQYIVVKSPTFASVNQMHYIYGLVQTFENALYSENGLDEAGNAYTDFIDMDSFVKRYVLDEISKNLDCGFSSYYFYKPKQEDKLYAGPVWDYDIALGNADGHAIEWGLNEPEGFYVNQNGWSKKLYEKPYFKELSMKAYREDFAPYIDTLLDGKIDTYAKRIEVASKMDEARWNREGWQEKVDYLKDYLKNRKTFLDREWGEE